MQEDFSFESLVLFLRQNILLVGVSLFGLIALGFGFFLMQPKDKEQQVMYEAGEMDSRSESGMTPRQAQGKQEEHIFVDIAGAVVKPGVYEVAKDSRVQDVLHKSGGLSEEADKQGIAKSVNLAAKVSDGMKLYFPFTGESPQVMGTSASNGTASSNGLINVNTASQSELEGLPGIGAVTAEKIIKARPYTSVEELKTKKVVGNAVFEKIKEQVGVN